MNQKFISQYNFNYKTNFNYSFTNSFYATALKKRKNL